MKCKTQPRLDASRTMLKTSAEVVAPPWMSPRKSRSVESWVTERDDEKSVSGRFAIRVGAWRLVVCGQRRGIHEARRQCRGLREGARSGHGAQTRSRHRTRAAAGEREPIETGADATASAGSDASRATVQSRTVENSASACGQPGAGNGSGGAPCPTSVRGREEMIRDGALARCVGWRLLDGGPQRRQVVIHRFWAGFP